MDELNATATLQSRLQQAQLVTLKVDGFLLWYHQTGSIHRRKVSPPFANRHASHLCFRAD